MTTKACLDANAMMELILQRSHMNDVMQVVRQQKQFCLTVLTVHIIMYFCSKHYTIRQLGVLFDDYEVISLTAEDVRWAFENMRNDDFEDALQISTAIRSGCTEFYTLDAEFYKAYRLLPQIKVRLIQNSVGSKY